MARRNRYDFDSSCWLTDSVGVHAVSNFIPPYIHEQFVRRNLCGEFQAATLFVDISGFTQLTESLMRHTKDGSEVLAEALDAIFNPLVTEVHGRGGLIPMYAGDAFTAIFPVTLPDQPEAAARVARQAVQTASFIHQFLAPDENERVFPTKYGDFRIGAKTGLSFGSVAWGIVESDIRNAFYFRGKAIEGCTKAEKLADTGQIVADSAVFDHLPHHVTVESLPISPNHHLVPPVSEIPPSAGTPRVLSGDDCRAFIPDVILDLPVRAEFREVCPVFISFEEPAEDAPLGEFIVEVLALTERYGGYFHQVEFGDKGGMAIVLFGAPRAHENSLERAARFVLALRERCGAIRWRAGLTFGTVWAGIRGNPARCEYAVIGDVVNLAARLAMRAEWGTAWVDREVYQRLRDTHGFAAVGRVQIRGKTSPLRVYTFKDTRTENAPTPYARTMVGRDRELAALASFLQPLAEEQFAGIIHIRGDAGMGKSRLASELRKQLEKKHNVAWFECPADAVLRHSLNPFRHFLRRHFEISIDRSVDENKRRFVTALDSLRFCLRTATGSTPDPEDLLAELDRTQPFLGAFLDLEWEGSLFEHLEPKLRLENMHAALKTFIKAESLRRPVILHLEDAQWVDDDSRDLLRNLVRNIEKFPVGIVCTSRYYDDGGCVTLETDDSIPQKSIELGKLDPDGIRALARQLLAGAPSDSLVAFLTDKTGGNPYFVEQLLLDLRERHAFHKISGGAWSLKETAAHVPTKIGSVLVARLDRLTARVKEVVQSAAVLGNEFEVRVLSGMLQDKQDVSEQVKEAESQQIWSAVEEMRYLFRHALMRDAAYEMQLQTRLGHLHRLAAEAIEQIHASDLSAHFADLAYHWGQAGMEEQECYYVKAAGKRAVARHALDEAMQYFSRALKLIPEDDTSEIYSILLSREQVATMQGAREVQQSDLDRLETLAKTMADATKQAEVAVRRAHFLEATGDFSTAVSVARDAIAFAQTCRDGAKEAAGYRLWGGALLRQGDYENSRGQLDRALSLARRADDQQEETTVLLNLGTVSSRLGDYRDAQSWYEEALRLARKRSDQAGEGSILNNLGSALYHAGDHESAQVYFRESLRICREIGYRLAECNALGNLATVSADRGDYAASRMDYGEALRVRREIGDKQGESLTLNNLGKIACDVGEYVVAQSYLERALHLAKHLGVRPIEGALYVNLSSLFHLIGDNTEALQHGNEALQIAEELGELRMMGYAHISRGHALADLGRLEDASGAYQKSASIRRQLGHEVLSLEAIGGLARVAMLQDDHRTAMAYVEQILNHLESGSLEGMSEPFAVYLTCYRVLAAKEDPRAQEVLSGSFALLQKQATRIGDDSVRVSFLNNVVAHAELIRIFRSTEKGETG